MNARKRKTLGVIRIIVLSILVVMVGVDFVLVFNEHNDYPTFSRVVRDHRTELIWLNFLFGGLVTKIYFNRIVHEKHWEISGVISYGSIVVLLGILGISIDMRLDTWHHLFIMICGGILAYRAWPQYVAKE